VDTGTGTDEDTGTETESDTGTGPDPECNYEGDWTWHDIPEGEDCGAGCTQLTFIEADGIEPETWDVWEDYLVYRVGAYGSSQPHVIDLSEKGDLVLPSPIEGSEFGPESVYTQFPTVFSNQVYYGVKDYSSQPKSRGIVRVRVSELCQQFLYSSTEPSEELSPFYYADVYDGIFVSATTFDAADDRRDLVYFDSAHPELGLHALIMSEGVSYGFRNQIWGDHIVWTDTRPPAYNIIGYNLATEQFFEVVNDEPHQYGARIWDGKVVYTDLRNGSGNYATNAENADIYLYEIATETTTRITDGEFIQWYPDIWENTIVWADYRDSTEPNNMNDFSGVEIYSYDLVSEEETKITDLPGRGKMYPRVFGNRIFFEMKDFQDDIQIYMVELGE
jgi:beta propeller repeat protein